MFVNPVIKCSVDRFTMNPARGVSGPVLRCPEGHEIPLKVVIPKPKALPTQVEMAMEKEMDEDCINL